MHAYIHTHTCMHAHIQHTHNTCIHTHASLHIYIHNTYKHMHTYSYAYKYMHAHTHSQICIHIYPQPYCLSKLKVNHLQVPGPIFLRFLVFHLFLPFLLSQMTGKWPTGPQKGHFFAKPWIPGLHEVLFFNLSCCNPKYLCRSDVILPKHVFPFYILIWKAYRRKKRENLGGCPTQGGSVWLRVQQTEVETLMFCDICLYHQCSNAKQLGPQIMLFSTIELEWSHLLVQVYNSGWQP